MSKFNATRRSKALLLCGASLAAILIAAPANAATLAGMTGRTATQITATTPPPRPAGFGGATTPSQAAQATSQSSKDFSAALATIQAQLAAQATARNAALAGPNNLGADPNHPGQQLPDVPNGLTAGGLVAHAGANPSQSDIANGLVWENANAPTQTTSGANTTVTVKQTAQKAILTWDSFNVGKNTSVHFDQTQGTQSDGSNTWIALNRIIDPSDRPSQILGNITAEGSVYLINKNGIIFGGSSQINVHSLLASSADIDNSQFLANGIYSNQINALYNPSFTDALGAITVEAGAQVTTATPASVTDGGGFVLLMGTSVANAGSIATPQGQAELAAGDDFVIRPGYGTQSNNFSTTRGNEVAPLLHSQGSSKGGGSGSVANTGIIQSPTGDITLAGETVTQGGVLVATTSVNVRGTIHLLSSASDPEGSVTLTGGGATIILPDDSGATALDSQRQALIAASGPNGLATGQFDNLSTLADLQDESRVEIVTGGNAVFDNGSLTLANGGQIAVSAANRVFASDGAVLDVSGLQNVSLAMSANDILVNVQGNEQRDDPNNRDTTDLNNTNLYVDARDLIFVPAGTGGYSSDRYYTAGGVLEVSGYLNNTGHTIQEWIADGGTVTLATGAAGSVVTQAGSQVNIAGGSIQYQGGMLNQSYLMGSDGVIYNANTAPANITYTGLYNGFNVQHPRWYLTDNYSNALIDPAQIYQPGYVVGRDAGRLVVSSPTAVLEGDVDASVINGPYQDAARPASVSDPYALPQDVVALPGSLALGQYGGLGLIGNYDTDVRFGDIASITAGMDADADLPDDRKNTAWLDTATLVAQNLGGISIVTAGNVAVETPLALSSGGQLTIVAPDIDIAADITARGGAVSLGNLQHVLLGVGQNTVWTALTDADGASHVMIGNGSTIDLRGLWTNAMLDRDVVSGLAFVDGGDLTVSTTGGVTLAAGSTIDVSSGGGILPSGKTQGGTGGNVSLMADDYAMLPIDVFFAADITQPLIVDGTIKGYGFNGGGTLTLGAGQTVVIGNDASLAGTTLAAGTAAPTSVTLAQPITIPAGSKMPMDYVVTQGNVPLDTPVPIAMTAVISTTSPPVTAAPWTVPPGMYVYVYNPSGSGTIFYSAGSTIPTGSRINSMAQIPQGITISSAVFPQGLPLASSYLVASYTAGEVVSAAVTLPAGLSVPAGTVFDQATAIKPVLALSPMLFQSGFSHYDISSTTGMEVTAPVTPTVPVYHFTNAGFAAASGSDPAAAGQLWTPPAYLANPFTGTLTQRAGADLTLSSLHDFTQAPGAAIAVDPGQSITVYANGQTTIDGDITAHGGAITVTSMQDQAGDGRYGSGFGNFSLTRSIWIGDGVTLDVSGHAVTAVDARGRTYGEVQDGGTISLGGTGQIYNDASTGASYPTSSDAFLIVRPGAVLDASGTSATLDILATTPTGATAAPVIDASNGGTIALYSADGIYLDGTIRAAAGGVGASGGTLVYDLVGHDYGVAAPGVQSPYSIGIVASPYAGGPNGIIGEIPDGIETLRNITLVQDSDGSGFAANLAPGASDPTLVFGYGTLGVNQVAAGGFDTVSLYTRDLFVFDGDINLHAGRSLTLSGGIFTTATDTPDISVVLSAPYVKLDGWNQGGTIEAAGAYYPGLNTNRGPSLNTAAASSFTVSADLLDLDGAIQFGVHGHQGNGDLGALNVTQVVGAPNTSDSSYLTGPDIVDAPGFGQVNLHSTSDVRLGNGSILADNLTFQAAQVYPMSGDTNTITVGEVLPLSQYGGIAQIAFNPDAILTVLGNGGATPPVPASVFGMLSLNAANIVQDGVLRAPLGTILFNESTSGVSYGYQTAVPLSVRFGDGSLTSVSANGLTIPYGGTSDGITYQDIGTLNPLGVTYLSGALLPYSGIVVSGDSVTADSGAVLDLSGGGDLTGAGFVSGRGGSVDVLTTPLINANPANSYSAASDKVYAILPGYASRYAPVIASNGAGDPAIGRQITIGAGVPGLPAGTYTLLPSSYALLSGGFRIELGGTVGTVNAPNQLANGSVITTGTLGVADTGIQDSLPVKVILSSGKAVRDYSQYDEESYSDFAVSQATLFGGVRPTLPEDGKILSIQLGLDPRTETDTFTFDGTALLDGNGDGSIGGTLVLGALGAAAGNVIDIVGPDATPVAGHVTISSDAINAFNAPTLMIGSGSQYFNDTTYGTGSRIYFFGNGGTINVLSGADIRAGEVFLNDNAINVASGATIDTHGLGSSGFDSSDGYVYDNVGNANTVAGPAVLAVANGWFNFLPVVGTSTISIASGASLLTDGSIVLGAPGSLTMGDIDLGARYLTVIQNQVNIGTADSLAAAASTLPTGWNLTQAVLDKLLAPPAESGLPALEDLTLTASGSVNLVGSVSLDARSQDGTAVEFVINTPAIYGLGDVSDVAIIAADSLVWNGIRTGNGGTGYPPVPYGNQPAAPIVAGGPGTGQGMLDITARDILFGYDANSRPTDGVSLDRYAVGFSNVNLSASDKVTANSDGTLTVGLSLDGSGAPVGGNLTLTTPLLADQQGASMSYKAGGAIAIVAPQGAVAADTGKVADIGGTVSFTSGAGITVDTAVALPSGQLTLDAQDDVALGAGADIDLAGRGLVFDDVTQYSWGGNLVMTSANGSIGQGAGSVIDVSAANSDAGSITATADRGNVGLDGTLKGTVTAGYNSGSITLAGQSLGDFATLNATLDAGGLFNVRSFDLRTGDLTVDSVKAHSVIISVDGGSLTVNGTIDASADAPGTIRLSSSGDLILASSAVLDAHGAILQIDSYGAPIDASNTAHVALASTNGAVTLNQGAAIDMTTPDGVARGHLEIDAPRLGAGDVAVNAGGPLAISGAGSIAVNAFQTYALADGSIIDQALLNTYDADSRAFIDAAYGNNVAGGVLTTNLQSRLAGLTAYGSAFHLRPGVEIASSGDLSTAGDIDLAGYRYGPGTNPSVRGSGEPGDLVIRAGGNLDINGSITDGFAPPPASPDALTVLASGNLSSAYTVTGSDVTLGAGAIIPRTARINIPLTYTNNVLISTSNSPVAAHPAPIDLVLSANWSPVGAYQTRTITGTVYAPDGSVFRSTGDTVGSAPWPAGTRIAAGTYFSNYIYNVQIQGGFTVPANTDLYIFGNYTFRQTTTLPIGTVLPSGMTNVTLTGPGDRRVEPIAPMLAAGTQSWSLRLVGGADLTSADSRGLAPASSLNGSGNVVLNDPYTVGLTGTGMATPGISVIRTGTGDLDILAAGDYQQETPYGIYTAGTAIPVDAAYNPARGLWADGTVLGAANSAYEATLGSQYMYFTQGGGDVLVKAQGNIEGDEVVDSTQVGGWLWREGGGGIDQATAWGINFGGYAAWNDGYGDPLLSLGGFSGIGALGGGNVVLSAGGNIGDAGRGVVAAVGGSGRVLADGSLAQTGGGMLSVTSGGNIGTGGNQFVDLRGNIDVLTDNFGTLASTGYGYDGGTDPRPLDPLTPYDAAAVSGGSFAPGDGVVSVHARGDLSMGVIIDPGRTGLEQLTAASSVQGSGEGVTWFTLWTDKTALDLFSGGDASPLSPTTGGSAILPAIINVTAAGGNIYLNPAQYGSSFMMPSRDGELGLFAANSVIEVADSFGQPFGPISASLSAIATPFKPAWEMVDSYGDVLDSNYWSNPANPADSNSQPAYNFSFYYDPYYGGSAFQGYGGQLFNFSADTVSDDSTSAADGLMSRIYARDGDVIGVTYGQVYQHSNYVGGQYIYADYYRAAKPVDILAGGDIVGVSGLILQNDPNDVSMVAAGGDVIYLGAPQANGAGNPGLQIAGPGTLEVTAGGNIYEGSSTSIDSIGPLMTGDTRPGANVVLQAGVGAGAPGVGAVNWGGFAALYLDPANQANAAIPDTDPANAGKVPKTYQDELTAWLGQNYGYAGTEADAYTYFETLPAPQQRVFLRQIYYDELNAGGLEYNDPTSKRYQSYLRGRDAIATLFPDQDTYDGDITLFSAATGTPGTANYQINSGYVHTDFGGDIQLLAPGGQVQVGTEGLLPGAAAGLITQGAGNIQIYADDSVLLGLSRIMTTFGGDILIWSATGDINAGRGAKTTVIYTPPKRTYDNYGNVALAPQVPSTGAGIATLAPIPGVPPGDVNLVAPEGVIDAGEAGIRVSGNLNVAALQVLNAANIQVQGKSFGLPPTPVTNLSLTTASTAATEAAAITQSLARQQPANSITVEVTGFGGQSAEPEDCIPSPTNACAAH